jgi:hypothetical protein
MKRLYILALFIFYTLLCNSCKKDKNTNDIYDNVPGLPPATQIGANTFGCLVNGMPWVPMGYNGTNNLSIDYDPGFNNGILNIVAYKFIAPIDEQILLSVRDSLNFLKAPFSINLSSSSLYGLSYKKFCHLWNRFPDVYSSGFLTIKMLDRNSGIIAGEFNATMYRVGCDTIKITQGRFDFRF